MVLFVLIYVVCCYKYGSTVTLANFNPIRIPVNSNFNSLLGCSKPEDEMSLAF